MIKSVEITDNKKAPLTYLHNIEAFANGVKFKFKPGVNVIVGENGSGKSTLINLIRDYTLCKDSMETHIPNVREQFGVLKFPNLWGNKRFNESEGFNDGVKVKADYKGKVFRLMFDDIQRNGHTFEDKIENYSLLMDMSSASTGEKMITAMSYLFNFMYGRTDYFFPIKELEKIQESSNGLWSERFKQLLDYYKKNSIKISKKNYEYTVLMDEPDRNLDIYHIKELYGILSERKERTQLITVIHNPLLIYKLTKLPQSKKVNFVELTPNYIDTIKEFYKWADNKRIYTKI